MIGLGRILQIGLGMRIDCVPYLVQYGCRLLHPTQLMVGSRNAHYRPHYLLVRRRVMGNLHDRLAAFEKAHIRGGKEP